MKKKLFTLCAMVLIVISAFSLFGCKDNKEKQNEELKDKNIFNEVLTESSEMSMFNVWGKDLIRGWSWNTVEGDYEIDVFLSDKLDMRNWAGFSFGLLTDKYRITKIKFDVVAQEDCTKKFYISGGGYDPTVEDVLTFDLKAGQVQQVEFSGLNIRKKDDKLLKYRRLSIGSERVSTREEFAGIYDFTTAWKIMNLQIFGELA